MNNITNKNEQNIFRLAATLYRDDNYQVGRPRTILKIIESLFLENHNNYATIEKLVDVCSTSYSLNIDEKEVFDLIDNNQKYFDIRNHTDSESEYKLTEKRYEYLLKKTDDVSIEKYIDLYLLEQNGVVEEAPKEKIFKFLYSTFTSNLDNYREFLEAVGNDYKIFKTDNVYPSDVELINGFLNFENKGKDKAIFDIVSLSLEYCLLTGNKPSFHAGNFSNKVFYLDSNMIYRAIGINGSDRKKLTLRFLERCLDFGVKFKILSTTESEFTESIEHKTENIYKFEHRHISRDVFRKYSTDDFYIYYYDWSKSKVNPNKDLFISYVLSGYEQIKTDFKIIKEFKDFLADVSGDEIKEISDVIRMKKNAYERNVTDFIVDYDARMVLSLREIRKAKKDDGKSILGTQNYLISTDQQLRDWEAQYYNTTPIILLPSQWMTMMFRFSGRSNDDYRSFVSFLTLKHNDSEFRNKYSVDRIHTVLSGISEITEDAEQQKKYAELIIDHDILGIVNTSNREQLFAKTISYVKEDLGDKLSEAQKQLELRESNSQESDEKVKELEGQVNLLVEDNKLISLENEKFKMDTNQQKITKKFKKWQRFGWITVLGFILILIWLLMHFFALESTNNTYIKVQSYINKLPEITQSIFVSIDVIVITSGLPTLLIMTINRFLKTSEKAKKKYAEIESEIIA